MDRFQYRLSTSVSLFLQRRYSGPGQMSRVKALLCCYEGWTPYRNGPAKRFGIRVIDGSGWLSLLTTANVTTDGRADVQCAPQVTAATLHCLRDQAYNVVETEAVGEGNPVLPFENWRTHIEKQHPNFRHWDKTLHLENRFHQFM